MGAVAVDHWDAPELERVHAVAPFRERRAEVVERFGPWAGGALDDIFWLLYKACPVLTDAAEVDRSHLVGHVLVSLLARNSTVARLRQSTIRDLVGAALAAAALAPQFAQTTVETRPPAMKDLEQAEGELGDQPGESRLVDLVDQRRQKVADQVSDADLEVLEAAVDAVAAQAEYVAQAADMWGVAGGELQRLSVPERMALAEKLDTARVRQVTDLFGRLRMSMFAERAELDDVGVEPVNVELGAELDRMVGAELLSMLCGELFYARVGDGSLMQYAVRGETDSRGGIVLCVDGSGSMGVPHQGYTREMWASALKLHLLHVAMRERRPLHVLDFGAPSELRYQRFVDPAEFTPARLLEAAGAWWGYGTDFATPLQRAIQVLADEDDRSSDVVFVSDGECTLSKRSLETYQRATRRRGVRTWGVQLAKRPGGLRSFCDHVFTITDLTSGRQLGALLNAVQGPR